MADAVEVVPITLADLSEVKLAGKGTFDVLMSAANLHVERQYNEDRIKGQDYAQVYLTAMQYAMQNAVQFLLQKDQSANQAALVKAQLLLAEAQVKLAEAELDRQELQKELVQAQVSLAQAQVEKLGQDVLLSKAQVQLAEAELDRQDLTKELMQKQVDKLTAETNNTVQELANLKAQECLLKAQYDLTMVQKLQTTSQTSLVQQKIATEKAQTIETGVDANSVIGKQKLLYAAQTDGFTRDAEQKAAKMLIDTWNVRRTTDEATVADGTNMLNDATIGRVVTKVLAGVKA